MNKNFLGRKKEVASVEEKKWKLGEAQTPNGNADEEEPSGPFGQVSDEVGCH